MTSVLAIVRLGIAGPGSTFTSPPALVPILIAVALLCVVGLTRRDHRTAAWLATIGAAFAVTIDLATYARQIEPYVDDPTWLWLGIAISLGAMLAVGSAAAYAFSRPRLKAGQLGVEATLVATSVIAAIAVLAIAGPTDLTLGPPSALGNLTLVTRTFLVLVPLLTALGVALDVLPAAERARRRVALTHRGTAPWTERIPPFGRAFADELSPGRRRARWAVLSERSRFARDVHKDVVPGLRQALAAAERGTPPDELAASLREVLADLEAVGETQHPIQLEIGGLIPALEWLAERLERRAYLRVTLNIGDAGNGSAGDLPTDIAAAAFHIAALALGNVVKHAPESHASIDVRASAELVDIIVYDDGPGISPESLAAASLNGRRGFSDMAAEAAAIGANLDVAPGPDGRGTAVTFNWRAVPYDGS
jgi:signal transduction histidine kinase